MPFATTAAGRISYTVSGPSEAVEDPETLLLIMGLGGSGAMWWRLLPHIARRHRRSSSITAAPVGPRASTGV